LDDRRTDSREEPRFLTEKGLATRWSVSRKKLQANRAAGKGLSYTKIGRCIRYQLEDVEAYERSNHVSFTSEGFIERPHTSPHSVADGGNARGADDEAK
jgi:hypothetical protein